MGIDSRITVTIEVPMLTTEAKSLPNTLIGLAGGPGLTGDSVEITYAIFDGRCRALHGEIMNIGKEYGLVEAEPDCVGHVTLFGRWGKVTDAQRGGSLLNTLYDRLMYSDLREHQMKFTEAIRLLTRMPSNVLRVEYHWH